MENAEKNSRRMVAGEGAGQALACAVLSRREIGAVAAMAGRLIDLLEAGTPVSPREVSRLIDRAEECRLVHRPGMVTSGLTYLFTESAARRTGVIVPAEQAMPAAKHIYNEASRALNILGNPAGYIPRLSQRLYGGATGGWKPLLP